METERKRWRLGDDVSAEDNILDGFTFKDLILAVHCNCESITPDAVRREAAEILEERMQDYRFLLRNNIEEIMAEAKKGRAQYGNTGYQPVRPHDAQLGKAERVDEATRARWRVCCHGRHPSAGDAENNADG